MYAYTHTYKDTYKQTYIHTYVYLHTHTQTCTYTIREDGERRLSTRERARASSLTETQAVFMSSLKA